MNKKLLLSIRSLVMLFCCPFLLIIFFACSYFYQTGKNQIATLIDNNATAIITQTRDDIEQKVSYAVSLPSKITTSSYYYKMRNNIYNGKDVFSANDYYNFSTSIYNFLSMNANYIDSILFYLDDHSITLYRSNSSALLKDIYYDFDSYEQIYKPYNMYWITNKSTLYPYTTYDDKVTTNSLIEVFGTSDSYVHGFLLININDELFTSALTNCKITSSSCVTLLKDGLIQYESEELYGNNTLEKLSNKDLRIIQDKSQNVSFGETIYYEISENYVIFQPLSLENLGILAIIPKTEMYFDYQNFSVASIRFSIVVISLCIVLYFIVTYIFSKPLNSLVTQLDYVSVNQFDIRVHANGGKEIFKICNSINNLIERMNLLIKNLEIEMTAKQKAELQALYFQINPHFLYNTLDCIRQLCDLNESQKASQMVKQLAIFYQIGVSKGNIQITLKEEMTHIEMYLAILKTRFEDFQYKIYLPEEYCNSFIIKLILQPIVENAICHGLRPFRTDGTIIINVSKEDSDLLIFVEDDGGGIPDNILDNIHFSLNRPLDQKNNAVYGIKNVHDRLRLTYGLKYGIKIQSVLDEGTTVILRIPYETNLNGDKNDENIIC